MLPATLVALVTFLLDLTNSSPVYNMQPAFITTNIGSTNGRNIRNLPCVSRKNSGLSGVCMFAIDCLKSNGTHLGTCIDRFYFGSCCHIEPIKEIGNSIETNIILDSREPPQRLHNKTSLLSTSNPQSILSSSSSTTPTSNELTQQTKESSSFIITTQKGTTTSKISSTTSSSNFKPTSITSPYGQKLPQGSTTSTTSTTEVTTIAQKLQTFQIVDGSLLEATTFKPTVFGTTNGTSSPIRTSTKLPSTTTRPRPGITSPSKPTRIPLTTTSKPTIKPTKSSKPASSRKPTQRPSKPVKVSSTTRSPSTTTTKSTSTRRTAATKPTRKVTKPTTSATSAKPVTITSKRPQQATTEKPTRKPVILTKKPLTSTSTTTSSIITKKPPSTSTSTLAASISTSSIPKLPASSSQEQSSTSTASSITTSNPAVVLTTTSIDNITKKNISQILETGTINTATNEVIESSGYLTFGNDIASTTRPIGSNTTTNDINTSIFNSTKETNISSSTFPTRPSTLSSTTTTPNANTSSTTTRPRPIPGIITWTLEDTKNHTAVNIENATVAMENITQEWIPLTTPDGWVLLPSVTSVTPSPSFTNNGTSTLSTLTNDTFPSIETISTFIPMVTLAPEISSTSSVVDIPITTNDPPDLTTNNVSSISTATQSFTAAQETSTSSPSLVTSIVTSTSEGDKGTTSIPMVTEIVGNVTTGGENLGNIETSGVATSTEYVPETKPVNMSDFTDVCGRRMWPEARIVGGEKSTFGKWPWQISLRQWRTSTYLHKCGAALLNENWAITAAHCVDNVPPSDLLLRLGEHDLSTETEPYLHEERRIQIVASHPQFDPRTFEYDLALLRFNEPVEFQPNILPVCVPTKEESFVGRTAFVTGWGRLYEDGPLPSILQEVSVPVINNSVCESMYRSAGYIEHIPHIFICAGWRRGGFDSCEGDSGGPMVIQRDDKRFLLAGVISWGIGCAEPNQPGVYTRISEFRDWINQILQF